MTRWKWAVTALGVVAGVSSAAAQTTTQTRSMSFEACLSAIRSTSSEVGAAPVNIVETNDTRIVRWTTADGSVVMACSRADSKMVVTVTKR